jgi:hypothetical protein
MTRLRLSPAPRGGVAAPLWRRRFAGASPIRPTTVERIYAARARWTKASAYVRPVRDPALGGTVGIVIMTLVAAFLGALLATGGAM